MMKIPSMLIVLMAVAPVVLADDAIDSALRGTDVSTDVEGQEDSWFGLRKLIGSNCIMVGNGVLPPFFRCNGCIIDLAVACVNDFKANSSGSIPRKCDPNRMTGAPNTECCPRYDVSRKRPVIDYKTSAYPQTLECIKSVGCELSQVYTDLMDNCLSVCHTVYPQFDVHTVCTDSFSSSISHYSIGVFSFIFTMVATVHVLTC